MQPKKSSADDAKQLPGPQLAYLVSQYPAISHTFILREVRELRRRGFGIYVASVNPVDRPSQDLTSEEREEAANTFCLKTAGVRGAVASQLAMLARYPLAYVRTAAYALALGGLDLRQLPKNLFYFVEAVMVAEWMRVQRLKHLHVHFATPASTVGMLAARLLPISLSLTVHGPDEFDEVGKYLLRQKVAACKRVFTISSYTRSQLLKLSASSEWQKISVLRLGVDPAAFIPLTSSEFEKRSLKNSGEFEVLCVGRLVPAKGQQVLVAAIERLLAMGRRVHLTLVGDGPDRLTLERCVQEKGLSSNVEFTGSINQDRIRDLYRRADVFALASFAEGVPIVLMEAMSMAIPCVATWVAGIPELIQDSVNGLLVAPSDEVALADALALLMDDAALRRRIGAAGRQRILDKYNLKRNVADLGCAFEKCVQVAA